MDTRQYDPQTRKALNTKWSEGQEQLAEQPS